MNRLFPLMQREWLQHRFGWALLALAPLALTLVVASFGQLEFDNAEPERMGAALPALIALVSVAASTVLVFLILWVTSVFITTGLARRDHGDRSIEFWLSLPVGHVPSLAVPMLVHLILVPAAALAVGLLGGYAISLVLVSRFVGLSAWFALPWGDLAAATLGLTLRLLAGLPLATLWLLPIILLAVLSKAWIGRWGLPVLALALALGSVLLDRVLGQPVLLQWLAEVGGNAGRAMAGASGRTGFEAHSAAEAFEALRAVPGWALSDLGAALRDLASPTFALGLALSAGGFALLVEFRRRGTKAAD